MCIKNARDKPVVSSLSLSVPPSPSLLYLLVYVLCVCVSLSLIPVEIFCVMERRAEVLTSSTVLLRSVAVQYGQVSGSY